MAAVTVDGTSYTLPADELTAAKVASYNSLLTALQAAWTTWAPTWANLNATGATVTGRYRQIGKLVICRLVIVLSNATPISGSVTFTLPVTAASYPGAVLAPLGQARLYDQSIPTTREGGVFWASTTTALIAVFDASGTYVTAAVLSSTVPFTWTTSDEISLSFMYEAA